MSAPRRKLVLLTGLATAATLIGLLLLLRGEAESKSRASAVRHTRTSAAQPDVVAANGTLERNAPGTADADRTRLREAGLGLETVLQNERAARENRTVDSHLFPVDDGEPSLELSDEGKRRHARIHAFFRSELAPKVRACYEKLAAGEVEFQYTYTRQGENWVIENEDDITILDSTLPEDQDVDALECMVEAAMETPFPLSEEQKARDSAGYAIFFTWDTPAPSAP